MRIAAFVIFITLAASSTFAATTAKPTVPRIGHVVIVVLENEGAASALKQPFMRELASRGALLTNFHAEARPSQPNYIALVSGNTWNVQGNSQTDIDVPHIGDLLDAKKLSWKTYAEGYPGGCFLRMVRGSKREGQYVRRHVPFISFLNMQRDVKRCAAHIVDAAQLDSDVANGTLPAFSLYIPNNQHNGHDSNIATADRWLRVRFGPLLDDPRFGSDVLFVVTFDEGAGIDATNHIATLLVGPRVRSGAKSDRRYDHYSLLRTVETTLGLGSLGQRDATAALIDDIWK